MCGLSRKRGKRCQPLFAGTLRQRHESVDEKEEQGEGYREKREEKREKRKERKEEGKGKRGEQSGETEGEDGSLSPAQLSTVPVRSAPSRRENKRWKKREKKKRDREMGAGPLSLAQPSNDPHSLRSLGIRRRRRRRRRKHPRSDLWPSLRLFRHARLHLRRRLRGTHLF